MHSFTQRQLSLLYVEKASDSVHESPKPSIRYFVFLRQPFSLETASATSLICCRVFQYLHLTHKITQHVLFLRCIQMGFRTRFCTVTCSLRVFIIKSNTKYPMHNSSSTYAHSFLYTASIAATIVSSNHCFRVLWCTGWVIVLVVVVAEAWILFIDLPHF